MVKFSLLYNIDLIRKEITNILSQHKLVNESQLLLQSQTGTDWYSIEAPYKLSSELRETDFSTLNIPTDSEIARFITDNALVRTRLMLLKPKSCYSWHKDVGKRVHLAVYTSQDCFFVENSILQHIPSDGYAYEVDVSSWHTALNCSTQDRLHIVGCKR